MADNNYDYPTDTPVVAEDMKLTVPWGQWFSRTHRAVFSSQQSGPSTERPTTVLWIGRRYYDTTLNQPIWLSDVKPAVWRNANGIIV